MSGGTDTRSALDRHIACVQRVTALRLELCEAEIEAARARSVALSELRAQNRDELEIAAALGEDFVQP